MQDVIKRIHDYSLEDLKNFRKIASPTTGHPEYNLNNRIECTTGLLGQGFATSIGMAIGEKACGLPLFSFVCRCATPRKIPIVTMTDTKVSIELIDKTAGALPPPCPVSYFLSGIKGIISFASLGTDMVCR